MTAHMGRGYDDHVQSGGYGKLIMFGVLVFLVTFFTLNAVINTPLGRINTGEHAVERHGEAEVESIRTCLTKNGADMVWVKRDDPNIKIFCVNMDKSTACGKWGAVFAQFWPSVVEQCDYRELTAFVPRDGTYHRVVRYLTNFAKRVK